MGTLARYGLNKLTSRNVIVVLVNLFCTNIIPDFNPFQHFGANRLTSIPPKNIRKPWVFCFQGEQKLINSLQNAGKYLHKEKHGYEIGKREKKMIFDQYVTKIETEDDGTLFPI